MQSSFSAILPASILHFSPLHCQNKMDLAPRKEGTEHFAVKTLQIFHTTLKCKPNILELCG